MKRMIPLLLSILLLTGCGGNSADATYQQIDQETVKEMMDTQEIIILDVREQDEYDSGHIPDAVLLLVGSIDEDAAAAVIPEKDSTVLVYCRSKTSSSTLAELGYTNIYEFGGINTWPYMRQSRNRRVGAGRRAKIADQDTKRTGLAKSRSRSLISGVLPPLRIFFSSRISFPAAWTGTGSGSR